MAYREKILEGEGQRFQLWWKFEGDHSHSLWVKDTKHGGGIRQLDLGGAHPRPESMEFVKEINDIANREQLHSAYRNFYKRKLEMAVAALEEIMNKETKANAELTPTGILAGEALNGIDDMDVTDEDRK